MEKTEGSVDQSIAVENSLKELLDKVLTYFEKFIKTKEDLKELESKLNDYENILSLVDIIKNVFGDLTAKIDEKLSTAGEDNYNQLEKIVQKYEGEIRNHIRVEQQLKLYAESLQSKLDDSEKTRGDLLDQSKGMINNIQQMQGIKRDNQRLAENLKAMKEENERLNTKLVSLDELVKEYEEKLGTIPILQEKIRTLEKMTNAEMRSTKSTLSSQYNTREMQSMKKLNLEVDYNKPHLRTDKSTGRSLTNSASNNNNNSNGHQVQHQSPLRNSSNRSTPGVSHSKNNSDYLKVKIEITENKQNKELEALKNSYQKFYNPLKQQRERNARSVSKTREIRSIYSNSNIAHNSSSNNSLLQQSSQNTSKDNGVMKLHKRSKSHAAPKARQSLTKKSFDPNEFISSNETHHSNNINYDKKVLNANQFLKPENRRYQKLQRASSNQ